jgi:hypothetical protein
MEPDPIEVPAATPIADALTVLADARGRLLYVIDAGPVRAISLTTAKTLWAASMRGEPLPAGKTAGDLALPVTGVRPDETLLGIGEKLWNVDWGELPVIDPAHPNRVLGTVTRRGLLGAFDRELIQRDVLTTRVASHDGVDYLELPDGHQVAMVTTPSWLVGRIPDLAALAREFGIKLIAVRRDPGGDAPPRWHDADAGFALSAGDRLMVIGTTAEIERIDVGPQSVTATSVTGPVIRD